MDAVHVMRSPLYTGYCITGRKHYKHWYLARYFQHNQHTHTHTHTHTPPTHKHTHTFDFSTPIAGGDDSAATAEAIATCAGIAPFTCLQG